MDLLTDAMKMAVAFLFKRKGAGRMKEDALRDVLSFDLRWFSPEEADMLIAKAVEQKILSRQDGYLAPNFDIEKLDVPLSFRPATGLLGNTDDENKTGTKHGKEKEPLFITILKDIEKVTTLSREQLMAKINSVQGSMDIDIEVAALIVASDFDIDVKPLARLVEEEIISRNA
jgi:hypothetical protein